MKKFAQALLLMSPLMIHFAVTRASEIPKITGGGVVSIFRPISAEDSSRIKSLSIYNQQIKTDVFDGYVVVNAKYWFNNSSGKNIDLKVGIPQGENDFSNIYWLRININNRAPFAASDTLINEHWQYWNMSFTPGITEVDLFYGVKTGGASFKAKVKSIPGNCFRYDFSDDRWWGSSSGKGEIWFRMNDGFVTRDVLGLIPDKKFTGGNSLLHAWTKDVLTDSTQRMLLWHRSLDSAAFSPGRISWEMKFSNLNLWNPNEKTLATLQPFSATDFEGKALQQEAEDANKLDQWKWISGIAITLLVLGAFIWSEVRSRRTQ